ncbi:MAG: hypothetical protein IPK72_22020 [Candidatus Eisenbacteria bacterium]|nr:hypothetical protein [Candidatus Eisenbacteria bacterium]
MAWDDSQLTRGLKGSEGKIAASGKRMSGAMKSAAGLFGGFAVGSFLKSSAQAFLQEENAIVKLRGALRASGADVDGATEMIRKLGSELQKTTTFEDDAVIGLAQMAMSMGVTTDKIEEVIKGAVGLSVAFGVSETTALKMSANAMQGKFTTLTRYVPALKNAKNEAEKMAIAQRAMANSFEVAREEAKSTSGQLTIMRNQWGDMKEDLGAKVAIPLMEGLRDMMPVIETLAKTMADTGQFVGKGVDGWRTLGKAIDDIDSKLLKLGNSGPSTEDERDRLRLRDKDLGPDGKPFHEKSQEERINEARAKARSLFPDLRQHQAPLLGGAFRTKSALDGFGARGVRDMKGLDDLKRGEWRLNAIPKNSGVDLRERQREHMIGQFRDLEFFQKQQMAEGAVGNPKKVEEILEKINANLEKTLNVRQTR